MDTITFKLSVVAQDQFDLVYQNDMLELLDELKQYSAEAIPIKKNNELKNVTNKAGDLNVIMGAVSISLPAATFAAILTSFIKNYFNLKKNRKVKIEQTSNKTSVIITGYNQIETQKLISTLTNSKLSKK